MFRKILTVALAAGAIAATCGTTVAQADDKALCKNGGYVAYVDPATSQPFTNQGQCVSYVAKGGTLVPVEEEPPPAPAPAVTFSQYYYYDNVTMIEARWYATPSTTFTYEWFVDGSSQGVQTVRIDPSGVGLVNMAVIDGATAELFINGVSAGTYTTH